VLAHAVGSAGQLDRALALNARALELESRIEAADRQLLGFEPRYWLWALRARYLALAGRASEAQAWIARLLDDPAESVDVLHRAQGLGVQLDLAVDAGDAAAVDVIASRFDELLSGPLTPYVAVLKGHYRGVALLAQGRWAEARAQLTETLAYARSNRAGTELEPYILANLGDATAGDDPVEAMAMEALEWLDDARELARKRTVRLAETGAIATRIRVCARLGIAESAEDRRAFESLLMETGAVGLRARLSGFAKRQDRRIGKRDSA
jgi:tetratricopeptide (TPR) repeat protein